MEILPGSRTAKREGGNINVDPRKVRSLSAWKLLFKTQSYLQMGSSKKMHFETTNGATAKFGKESEGVSTPRGPAVRFYKSWSVSKTTNLSQKACVRNSCNRTSRSVKTKRLTSANRSSLVDFLRSNEPRSSFSTEYFLLFCNPKMFLEYRSRNFQSRS